MAAYDPKRLITYSAFSGADMVATLSIPGIKEYTIGTLEAISYSIHRETYPVHVTGYAWPRGFTRGPRLAGGTLVFLTFDRHVIYEFIDALKSSWESLWEGRGFVPPFPANLRMDAMPPFDVTITAANEMGLTGVARVKGIVVVDEGQTARIDQLATDATLQFVARDVEPWHPIELSIT